MFSQPSRVGGVVNDFGVSKMAMCIYGVRHMHDGTMNGEENINSYGPLCLPGRQPIPPIILTL